MKFHWHFIKTKNKQEDASLTLEIGQQICGLQMRGERPHTIELSYAEFIKLLNVPKYLHSSILPALKMELNNNEFN